MFDAVEAMWQGYKIPDVVQSGALLKVSTMYVEHTMEPQFTSEIITASTFFIVFCCMGAFLHNIGLVSYLM